MKENDIRERSPDFQNEEGLWYCGVCREPKENSYSLFGNTRVFHCLCRCGREELKEKQMEDEKREMRIYIDRIKAVGLTEHRFYEWCFANDNGSNPKLNLARDYVKNWKEMQENQIGYLLMGPVGSGKSFFAGCIANALMDQGVSVMMTNLSRVINELTKPQVDKNMFISDLVSYPLLVIDDFGIERQTEFALEMIFHVIDRRYCTGRPLIVTTNLSYQDMTRPDLDISHKRIYSRLLELCIPISYQGEDQRSSTQAIKMTWMKNHTRG